MRDKTPNYIAYARLNSLTTSNLRTCIMVNVQYAYLFCENLLLPMLNAKSKLVNKGVLAASYQQPLLPRVTQTFA